MHATTNRKGKQTDLTERGPTSQRFPESSQRSSLVPPFQASTSGSRDPDTDNEDYPSEIDAVKADGILTNAHPKGDSPSSRAAGEEPSPKDHLSQGKGHGPPHETLGYVSPGPTSGPGSPQKDVFFSKVVLTKFSNPQGYREKKVKFHRCTICEKAFPRPSGLRTHMNIHTKSKPYLCHWEGCNKAFSVTSNAKRHYRTHLSGPLEDGEQPFVPYGVIDFEEPVVVDNEFFRKGSGVPASRELHNELIQETHSRPVSLRWLPLGSNTRRARPPASRLVMATVDARDLGRLSSK